MIILLLLACAIEVPNTELYNQGFEDGCNFGQSQACKEEFTEEVEDLDPLEEYSIGFYDGYFECVYIWEEVNGC